MNRYLLLYALLATALCYLLFDHYHREEQRLRQNQSALIAHYRGRIDSLNASGEVLRLRCREFESLHAEAADRIRTLGIRLRRLEASATTVTHEEVQMSAPIDDTLIIRHHDTLPLCDTLRPFAWQDAWVRISGHIARDSIHCRITSYDTLHQIIHRVPRRFLFFRWGTKAIRQEIRSSNPHTRICYAEYVIIER